MVDVAAVVAAACQRAVSEGSPIPGGDICRAWRVTLDDGQVAFAKTLTGVPDLFDAEARSLAWLADGGAPVPAVLGVRDDVLVLDWLPAGAPSVAAAARLGRELAAVHASGADRFGAPWPGFAGRLRLPNEPAADWAEFFAATRLLPLVRQAADGGALDSSQAGLLDRLGHRLADLGGPPEPPARLHGDLWSGNLLWTDERAWLIDPAAYGGHRETDLAMLDLFGTPHLDRIVAAYAEVTPLADGWRDRIGLHQLHPLLAHAVMFGGGYGARAAAVARRYA
ncbi:MAG TPA: fructosamine kinase family protein [Jatrophihabitantaceae bacterium]|nr:fructosamine kinase family protein [Jatrophihabitantaceae bacterium]